MRYSRLSVMVISDKPRNGVVEKGSVSVPSHRPRHSTCERVNRSRTPAMSYRHF